MTGQPDCEKLMHEIYQFKKMFVRLPNDMGNGFVITIGGVINS